MLVRMIPRLSFVALILSVIAGAAAADTLRFPAPSGAQDRPLRLYMSLDEDLARPLIQGFQALNPDIAVEYQDLLTGQIFARITEETDAGGTTADLAFSSAMDLQIKLANDGYAQAVATPSSAESWPQM